MRYTPAPCFVGTDSFTYTVKGTRVIVLSFVALALLATPREGTVQPPPASDTRVIVGSGLGDQSRVRVFDGDTGAPLSAPLRSFIAFTQNPPPLGSSSTSAVGLRVAGCRLNGDGTDEIIVITS